MTTYEVTATRDERFWAIEVTGVPMGYTQAARLSEVDEMVRDLVSLLLNVEPDSFDIDLHVNVEGADKAREAVTFRAGADAMRARAQASMRIAALALSAQRVPVRDIATMLGVSAQRVSQLTAEDAA